MKRRLDVVLRQDFGMRIKQNWQIYKFDYVDKKDGRRKGRFMDFVGMRFYRDHTTIRRKTFKRMMKVITDLTRKGIDQISRREASTLIAYYGLMQRCDSIGVYMRRVRPHFPLKEVKRILRETVDEIKK